VGDVHSLPRELGDRDENRYDGAEEGDGPHRPSDLTAHLHLKVVEALIDPGKATVHLPEPIIDLLEALVDLLEALVDLLEALVDLLEALVHLLEALVHLLEALVDLLESLVDLFEPFVDLLKALVDLFKALVNLLEALVDLFESLIDALLELRNALLQHVEPGEHLAVHPKSTSSLTVGAFVPVNRALLEVVVEPPDEVFGSFLPQRGADAFRKGRGHTDT
jgi:AcrR family transcriptional regulator